MTENSPYDEHTTHARARASKLDDDDDDDDDERKGNHTTGAISARDTVQPSKVVR